VSGFKRAILGMVGSRITARARVEAVEAVTDHFRLIDIVADDLKSAVWQPAAKIQIDTGNWEMRTYTPLSIDAASGRVRVLAFVHGNGAGSTWARSAKPGDATHIKGPRGSLDLRGLAEPTVFFGDETSFAAARTLEAHLASKRATRLVFEVSSVTEALAVARRLELHDYQFFERREGDAHTPDVVRAVRGALDEIAAPHLVMTGNGLSIRAIRAALRSRGRVEYHTRAYWVPGKAALD
jgi:ferric-chelate reductase (NADPH)